MARNIDKNIAKLEDIIKLRRLERVEKRLKEIIEEEKIDTSHKLKDSIKINVVKNKIQVLAPYFNVIEYGRKPGGKLPPYKAIRAWVGKKYGFTGRKKAHKVAWAIMLKIQKEGIKGKHILRRAWLEATGGGGRVK